ncbi:hypothetical protein CHARACLAT_026122, partial [Characodon lateralis]|nr:hypothetical protein [Characodon lateralis]
MAEVEDKTFVVQQGGFGSKGDGSAIGRLTFDTSHLSVRCSSLDQFRPLGGVDHFLSVKISAAIQPWAVLDNSSPHDSPLSTLRWRSAILRLPELTEFGRKSDRSGQTPTHLPKPNTKLRSELQHLREIKCTKEKGLLKSESCLEKSAVAKRNSVSKERFESRRHTEDTSLVFFYYLFLVFIFSSWEKGRKMPKA